MELESTLPTSMQPATTGKAEGGLSDDELDAWITGLQEEYIARGKDHPEEQEWIQQQIKGVRSLKGLPQNERLAAMAGLAASGQDVLSTASGSVGPGNPVDPNDVVKKAKKHEESKNPFLRGVAKLCKGCASLVGYTLYGVGVAATVGVVLVMAIPAITVSLATYGIARLATQDEQAEKAGLAAGAVMIFLPAAPAVAVCGLGTAFLKLGGKPERMDQFVRGMKDFGKLMTGRGFAPKHDG